MSEQSDHDLITVLVERVNNLIQSQTDFHKLVNANFEELRWNYSNKIQNHETRINKLESAKTKQMVITSIWIWMFWFLATLLVYHIIK